MSQQRHRFKHRRYGFTSNLHFTNVEGLCDFGQVPSFSLHKVRVIDPTYVNWGDGSEDKVLALGV